MGSIVREPASKKIERALQVARARLELFRACDGEDFGSEPFLKADYDSMVFMLETGLYLCREVEKLPIRDIVGTYRIWGPYGVMAAKILGEDPFGEVVDP